MLYSWLVLVLIAFSNQPIIVPIIVVTTVMVIYLDIEYLLNENDDCAAPCEAHDCVAKDLGLN